jgi:acetate kinase
VISCHLGNGCSISAIVNGKSIENSMGFTPLDGLVMGTRSGSIDPGIIDYLHTQKGMSLLQITHMLNRESGLLGLSGIGGDVRDLLASKKPRAKLALEVFVYRIISTVGSYITVMGGVDTIVFTGGIGQNSGQVRKMVCDYFGYIGLSLDSAANRKNALVISSAKSKINVRVVVADEERAIVEKTIKLIR